MLTACVCLASLAAAPFQQKLLVQYDQFKVPREPASRGGTQTNVTGLIEWLRDTHANAFSFLLWDTNGAAYLDFVRVLSLTSGIRVDDVLFRLHVTLIPPSEARPSAGTNITRCSVPADSPLTSFNESALFNASLGNRGCLDYVAWCDVISRLGQRWPHLDAINIDDFSSNTGTTFTQPYLSKMRAALAGSVRLIPTFYYGHGPKDFTLDTRPYLRNLTDGVLFYFRNNREGQQGCAADSCGTPGCSLPCLDGTCAERSVPNLPVEIADVASRLPPNHPLLVGIYFTAYNGCAQPSVDYNREVLAAALALPSVAGATIYITQHPHDQPASCTAASSDKGCVVRLGFGGWNATVAARSFSSKCPPALPFRAPADSAGERCCGSTASFPACGATASCCLDGDCTSDIPACFCPSAQPYEYGNALGGYFCCANQSGFPTHCNAGGECCLRPGLKNGCQGRQLCGALPVAGAMKIASVQSGHMSLSTSPSTSPLPPPTDVAKLVRLTDDPRARCLDGSAAAYYISHPPAGLETTISTKFYIVHEGGGWCQNISECGQRARTHLGSSVNYSDTAELMKRETHIFFERNATRNPLTAAWTHVYLPYCDGASWAGDSSARGPDGKQLYFRGTAIREAVVSSLRRHFGFAQATDVLIGGCSAGATAVYLHIDWYAAQAPRAKVRGMPDSGWFLPGSYHRDRKPNYSARMANLFTMVNATASLPTGCLSAHGRSGYLCLFAERVIPYVTTPLLALNSRFDASMGPGKYERGVGEMGATYSCTPYLGVPCNATSVDEFGAYIASSMRKLLRPPHGAYLDACFRHCSTNDHAYNIHMHGTNASYAAAEWYGHGSAALPNGGWWEQSSGLFRCDTCCM